MAITRRKMLGLVGGGAIVAAAGIGVFAATRTPGRALAPWEKAGQYDDPRARALSYALLAPNPHNRQPWLADLSQDDMVILSRDPERNLPATDPYDRQITIGMGCFVELMELAAKEEGIAVQTELFPQGEGGPLAVCRFEKDGAVADPLFQHVMSRRSHKDAFEQRPLADADRAVISNYGTLEAGSDKADQLRRIARDAWLAEVQTPAAWQESIDLLRIGKAEINVQPDGIDVGGAQMEALALVGLLSREAAADPENPGTKSVIQATLDAIADASGFVVQVTPGNSRHDQIAAGRAWLRLNLATTGAGLALRPVSQALQEYPEVAPMYDDIHQLMAPNGETVQMLGLVGYGRQTPRTPRWPLETRLVHA